MKTYPHERLSPTPWPGKDPNIIGVALCWWLGEYGTIPYQCDVCRVQLEHVWSTTQYCPKCDTYLVLSSADLTHIIFPAC